MAWVVSQLRPRYVIMENVAAILGRELDVVAGDLAEIGYDLEWDCIPAAAVGAPHRRDRWWGIAYPHSERHIGGGLSAGGATGVRHASRGGRRDEALARRCADDVANGFDRMAAATDVADLAGDGRGQRRPRRFIGSSADREAERAETLADADSTSRRAAWAAGETVLESGEVERPGRCGGSIWHQPRWSDWWAVESGLGQCSDGVPAGLDGSDWERGIPRVARGVPDRVNRLKALGNAVVPQVAQHVGEVVLALEAERQGEMRGSGRELVS